MVDRSWVAEFTGSCACPDRLLNVRSFFVPPTTMRL